MECGAVLRPSGVPLGTGRSWPLQGAGSGPARLSCEPPASEETCCPPRQCERLSAPPSVSIWLPLPPYAL